MSYDVNIHINANDSTSAGLNSVKSGFDGIDKSVRKTGDGFKLLNSQAAQFVKGFLIHDALRLAKDGVRDLGQSFYDVNSKAETFMVTLETLYHSVAKAEQKYAEFERFAQKTPFNFADVGEQAVKLKAYNLEPTLELLTVIGDTAAAFGGKKDVLDGIVRALGQMAAKGEAAGQELRQLAEWGVPVYEILQQKLGLTAEQVQEIGKHGVKSSEAVAALLEGLAERFGGQMEKMRGNMQGITGEIGDLWFQIMKRVGDAGAWQPVKDALAELRDFLSEAKEDGRLDHWAANIADGMVSAVDSARVLVPIMAQIAGTAASIALDMASIPGKFKGTADSGANLAAGTIGRGVNNLESTVSDALADLLEKVFPFASGSGTPVDRTISAYRGRASDARQHNAMFDIEGMSEGLDAFYGGGLDPAPVVGGLDEVGNAAKRVKTAAEEARTALRKLVEGTEATGPATMTAEEVEYRSGILQDRVRTIMATGGVEGEWAQAQMREIRAEAATLKEQSGLLGRPRIELEDFYADMGALEDGLDALAQEIETPKRFSLDVSEAVAATDEVRRAIDAIPSVKTVRVRYVTEGGADVAMDQALAERIATGRSQTGEAVREIINRNADGSGSASAQVYKDKA